MGTPINQELRELRMVKEHYQIVLRNDAKMKESGQVGDVPLLSDKDILKINQKIDSITVEIDKLLNVDKGYEDH